MSVFTYIYRIRFAQTGAFSLGEVRLGGMRWLPYENHLCPIRG